MKNRILYILRGISGCGKTSFAETLTSKDNIASADDYFYINGEYVFNVDELSQAHKQCFDKVEKLMQVNEDKIVVSNTNTRNEDVELYMNLAAKYNYKNYVLVVENRHGGINSHDVPKESLDIQENQLRNSLKLR